MEQPAEHPVRFALDGCKVWSDPGDNVIHVQPMRDWDATPSVTFCEFTGDFQDGPALVVHRPDGSEHFRIGGGRDTVAYAGMAT